MRCFAAMSLALASFSASAAEIYIQAHRGGLEEAPENTMAAFEHAWRVPGAIPEMDLRTTSDGVIILIHDETPARTTDAPPPWNTKKWPEIPHAEAAKWRIEAGKWQVETTKWPQFPEQHIPTLDEVFALLKKHPEREVYLDLKDVALETLKQRILDAGVEKQIIFVHGDLAMCATLKALYPGARTMSWLSGTPEKIRARYTALNDDQIRGVSQLQFHLTVAAPGPPIVYALDDEFLRAASARLRALGVEIQLRPFKFDAESMARLTALGVRWYVADAPAALQAAAAGAPK